MLQQISKILNRTATGKGPAIGGEHLGDIPEEKQSYELHVGMDSMCYLLYIERASFIIKLKK